LGPQLTVRIKENTLIARIAALKLGATHSGAAIVFGKTIYLYKVSRQQLLANQPYLRHELAHVIQWHWEGCARFLLKYIWYTIRYGYRNNPYEVEARQAQTDNDILKQFFIL